MKYTKIKHKKIPSGFFLVGWIVLMLVGCDTVLDTNPNNTDELNVEANLTPQELELRNKLKATVIHLQEVIKQPSALEELQVAIDFYTQKYQRDERVGFRKLFNEAAQYKNTWVEKRKSSPASPSFKEIFRSTSIKAKAEESASSYSVEELEQFLKEKNIEIYYPYSENWKDEKIPPTLTYHPIDNEDINEGWQPVISQTKTANKSDLSGIKEWKKVTVDDAYAYANKTMIIVPPEGVETVDSGELDAGGEVSTRQMKSSNCSGENCAHKVQIGWARLTEHFDGVFAGGSEIRWVSADLVQFLSNGTPELKANRVAYNFSRKDIKKKRWKELFTQFDSDWEEAELAKELLIYEADGNGLTTLKLGAKLDLGSAEISGSVDYKLSKKRSTLLQTYYKRSVFMAENTTNISNNGVRDGFGVRYANHLKWTMPMIEIPLN